MKLTVLADSEWREPDPEDFTIEQPWRCPIFQDSDHVEIGYTIGKTREQAIERAQQICAGVNGPEPEF